MYYLIHRGEYMNIKYSIDIGDYVTQLKDGSSSSIPTPELLEMALFPKRKQKRRSRTIKKLLDKTDNSLSKLFSEKSYDFVRNTGLEEVDFIGFRATRELYERALTQELLKGDAYNSSEKTRKLLSSKLRFHTVELFVCMYLDCQYQLISFEQHTLGSINGTFVHPREIVKRVLELNAAALIVAHNHPSGVSNPSEADTIITKQLSDALKLIEVSLLDHFIVSGNKVLSLAEKQLL